MSLTTLELARHLRRRLDGDPSLSVETLRDHAGEHLVSMHEWAWLVRPATKLSLSAGQPFIWLPEDWGRSQGRPRATTLDSVHTFEWVTMPELLDLRSSVVLDNGPNYRGAVTYAQCPEGYLKPRAEIWPTPSETFMNAFAAPYMAGWKIPRDDNDALLMPSWMEAVYLEILFAFAQGYDEHDVAAQGSRLEALSRSPALLAAKRRDGGVSPFVGKMRGGAMDAELGYGRAAIGIAARLEGPS